MGFWQILTVITLIIGLISSLIAIIGFFTDKSTLKSKHKILLISIPLAIIFLAGGIISFLSYSSKSSNASASTNISSKDQSPTTSKSTPTITLSPTPTPVIRPALSDTEFPANDAKYPATIVGPAIIEWADPNCGIFKLDAGKKFTWNSDGHYWIFLNQASLDYYWPSHLSAYQSKKENGSCIVGTP